VGRQKEKARRKRAATDSLAAAIALHQRGQLAEAEALYTRLIAANPNHAGALCFLGVLRHQQDRPLVAIELVRRALAIDPNYVDAHNNLGNIYQQVKDPEEAAKCYRAALALQPEHPQALRNLGIVLRELQRFEESADSLRRALVRDPDNVHTLRDLATVNEDLGRHDEAISLLRRAIAIKPHGDSFRRLGAMLYATKRIDEAAGVYRSWLAADPDSPVARHMLAACSAENIPSRADDAYVTEIFDKFAASFDEVLHKLEYRAPALLGGALGRTGLEPRGDLDVVDAGCGTGLLAPYLRPYARRLVGVDLSPKMLEKATQRSIYDEAVVAELGAFLRASPGAFDLVASADTLVYFGDLREVFAAAHASLRPGGRLLFSVERAGDGDSTPDGYRINPHGRYSHTERYVRECLAGAALTVVTIEPAELRRESTTSVAGMVVVARRA
jgi:predicted TPR repeat methyltransferase